MVGFGGGDGGFGGGDRGGDGVIWRGRWGDLEGEMG